MVARLLDEWGLKEPGLNSEDSHIDSFGGLIYYGCEGRWGGSRVRARGISWQGHLLLTESASTTN